MRANIGHTSERSRSESSENFLAAVNTAVCVPSGPTIAFFTVFCVVPDFFYHIFETMRSFMLELLSWAFCCAAELQKGNDSPTRPCASRSRWLQAVAEAPPSELCSDRHVDGLDTELTVSRLATVALTIEPIVRG